jgi:hypothetical protein
MQRGRLTTIFYREESQSSELLVVNSQTRRGRPTKNRMEAMIRNPGLFPRGCGEYLMGARVLPGAERLALLYAAEVVRIIDYQGTVVSALDPRDPNTGYTCEGYDPNKDARRDQVKVVPLKRELWANVSDHKNPVLSDCKPLSREAQRYLDEELSILKGTLEVTRFRLAHAADEEERKRYQDSVTLLEEEVSKIEETLVSGQTCRSTPRQVPYRLAY